MRFAGFSFEAAGDQIVFSTVIIAGLCHILSLQFNLYWICFCAGEMSKYMFIFSLELQ